MSKAGILLNVGAACRARRRALDLTITDVAERFGCSPGNIVRFERGENNNLLYYIFAIVCNYDKTKFEKWRMTTWQD